MNLVKLLRHYERSSQPNLIALIDLQRALTHMGFSSNYQALASLIKTFEQSQPGLINYI